MEQRNYTLNIADIQDTVIDGYPVERRMRQLQVVELDLFLQENGMDNRTCFRNFYASSLAKTIRLYNQLLQNNH